MKEEKCIYEALREEKYIPGDTVQINNTIYVIDNIGKYPVSQKPYIDAHELKTETQKGSACIVRFDLTNLLCHFKRIQQ